MNRLARVTVFLLGVVFLIFLVSEYYPAFYRARIIDAPGEAILQPYAAEFAAAAGYKYLADTGPPHPAPVRNVHSGGRPSAGYF
jgi:hypothetical protein